MSPKVARVVATCLAVCALIAAAPRARADASDPSPEARAANARALELDEKGQYAEALGEFQHAYDLSPSYRILYNIARTSRLTQDFARSLSAYQRFLTEGGADVDPAQRAISERQIAELSSLVGWIVVSGRDGTTLSVDGRGAAPLSMEPLPLNPGAHTAHAALGSQSLDRTFTVRAGETAKVDVTIEAPKRIVPPPEPFRFPSVITVASWVTTGLFAGASVATGAAALALSDDLADDVYVGPATSPEPNTPIADKASRLDQLTTATNVLMGLGVVSGVASIAFSMIDGLSAPDAPSEAASTPVVQVLPTPNGVLVRGTF